MGVYFELSSVPNNPSPHPEIQKDVTRCDTYVTRCALDVTPTLVL